MTVSPSTDAAAPSRAETDFTLAPSARASVRSWPWRRGGFLLAGAAQLITISALVGMDHPPVTWAALLLAIAPGPLAWAAGFAEGAPARLLTLATLAVLVAGIAGYATHTGLFFVPALAVLLVGAAKLWREQT